MARPEFKVTGQVHMEALSGFVQEKMPEYSATIGEPKYKDIGSWFLDVVHKKIAYERPWAVIIYYADRDAIGFSELDKNHEADFTTESNEYYQEIDEVKQRLLNMASKDSPTS